MNAQNIADISAAAQLQIPDDLDIARLQDSGPLQAVECLKTLDAEGWHHLDAFDPVSGRWDDSRTFPPGSWREIEDWVRARILSRNIYFSANEPIPGARDGKLAKEDIAFVRCLYADVDAAKDATVDVLADQSRLDHLVRKSIAGAWPATLTVHTGNGRQFLWRLHDKLSADEHRPLAEAQGRAIAHALGGDNVQNIDRILRLPGTLNLPSPAKRKLGRAVQAARIIDVKLFSYHLDELARYAPPVERLVEPEDKFIDEARAELEAADLSQVPAELAQRFADACRYFPRLDNLWRGVAKDAESDDSGSGYRASLARRMAEAGFGVVDYGQMVRSWELPPVDADKIDPDTWEGLRQLSRDWANCGRPHAVAQWFDEPSTTEPLFPEATAEAAPSDTEFDFDAATLVSPGDIDHIPEKEFVLGTRFQPGSITLGIGPAGVGKSMFAILTAVSIATRRELTGELVSKSGSVLIFNAEDPSDEMRRRLKALISYYKLPADEVLSRVRLLSGYDQHRLVLARRNDRHGEIKPGKDLKALADFILRVGIVHVVLDPLVALHRGLEENSATDMEELMDGLRWLARSTAVSIDLIHHTVKNRSTTSEQNAGVGDASRGSGAIFAAARSNYTLMPMAPKTGIELGLPQERVAQMIRLDDGKRNNTRRAARERWFEIQSVLPSGEVIPGWHFDTSDRSMRKRALESVGLHVPFDAVAQHRIAMLNNADDAQQQTQALRSLIVASMDAGEVDRARIVEAYRAIRSVSETTARTTIDEALPEGRNRAIEVDGDDVRYLLWRRKVGTKWVICREALGQIVHSQPQWTDSDDENAEIGGVLG
jgi:hypothetical protein